MCHRSKGQERIKSSCLSQASFIQHIFLECLLHANTARGWGYKDERHTVLALEEHTVYLAGGRQTRKLKNYTVLSVFTEILLKHRRSTEQLTWGEGVDTCSDLSAISIFIYPQSRTRKDMKKLSNTVLEQHKKQVKENLSELKIRVRKIRSQE